MSTALYFAPRFFSPDYFAPLVPLQPPSPSGSPGFFRDRDIFNAISAALAATGEFSDVVLGEPTDQGTFGANRVPLAVISPIQWDENDWYDPISLVRQVTYKVTLIVRGDDPGARFDLLDRLSSLVQNTLDGSSLNGGCLPALTKLRQGRYDPNPRFPEQRLSLLGEFSYMIDGFQNHQT